MGSGMPSSMTPDVYQRQMQGRMQRMQKQMAAIAAESASELDSITDYLDKHAASGR
jgi:hypothetical protein